MLSVGFETSHGEVVNPGDVMIVMVEYECTKCHRVPTTISLEVEYTGLMVHDEENGVIRGWFKIIKTPEYDCFDLQKMSYIWLSHAGSPDYRTALNNLRRPSINLS